MRTHVDRLLTACAILAVTACDSSEDREIGFSVDDSAGVRVVSNAEPAWEEADEWRLTEVPDVEIGALGGSPAYEFHEVAGVVKLDGGQWMVADGASAELRVYDDRGVHQRTVGRRGGGPNEFSRIQRVFRIDDGALAIGESSNTFKLLDPDSEFRRNVQLAPTTPGLTFRVIGWLDSTKAWVSEYERPSPNPGSTGAAQVAFSVVETDGSLVQEVARIPGPTWYGRDVGTPLSLTLGGRLLSYAQGGQLVIALPSGDIHTYTSDGSLNMVVRRIGSVVTIDDVIIREYVEASLEDLARSDVPAALLEQARDQLESSTVFATEVAPFSQLILDGVGNVWAREWSMRHDLPQSVRYPTFDDVSRWKVFDEMGRWRGVVLTPANFHVFEIGSDYVAGLFRDEFDVELVRVYGLDKSGR